MKDDSLRTLLVKMLEEENAHASIETALEGVSPDLAGVKPENFPYSIWQLAEHIRIAQWDIVEFSYNPDHVSPKWPDAYWPHSPRPAAGQWERTIEAIKKDRRKMISLIQDKNNDLLKPFPYGDGQNLLREVMLLSDHTSYHTGQIVLVRKLLDAWE